MFARFVSLAVLVAVCVLSGASTARAQSTIAVTPCTGWTNQFVPTSVTVTPNPPVLAKPVKLATPGTLKTVVTKGAKVVTTAIVGALTVQNTTLDVCTFFGATGLMCPIAAGTHNLAFELQPPANVPPFVAIKYRSEAYNGDGTKLFCFTATIKFKP